MTIVALVALLLAAAMFGTGLGLALRRTRVPTPIIWSDAERTDRPERAPWAGDDRFPAIADSHMVWADVRAALDLLDTRLAAARAATVEPIVPPMGGFSVRTPFVAQRPAEAVLTIGSDLPYCYAPVSGVVHDRACTKAPREENRKYLWAFSPAEAVEWVVNEADGGQELRPCQACKPFELEVTTR